MAEETEDSARSVPRTILYSTYINALLGFLLIITLMFTWGNMAEIADSAYGWPFLIIFYKTTGSKAATIATTMLIILPMTGSVIACVANSSRQTWAFAGDNGVPLSATVSHASTPSLYVLKTALTGPPRSTPNPPSPSMPSSSHSFFAFSSPSSTSAPPRLSTPFSHSISPSCSPPTASPSAVSCSSA